MSKPFDLSKQLAEFTGQAPLFPLRDVVLFPHLLLPLHVFEPRYRRMVAESLADDRMIAMALLKPENPLETDTVATGTVPEKSVPPIHEMVCVGRITAEERLDDGRYYLVLQGLSRARVVSEQPSCRPYRIADLELQTDLESSLSEEAARIERLRLLQAFRELFPRQELDRVFRQALDESVPVGLLCDVLADAMSLTPQVAYEVFAEVNVERRCRLVMRLIREKLRRRGKSLRAAWPPKFSLN